MRVRQVVVVAVAVGGLAGCGDDVLLGGALGTDGGVASVARRDAATGPSDATTTNVSPGDAYADEATVEDGGAQDASSDGPTALDAGATAPAPASCATGGDGLSNCGQNLESCCTSLEVEGGTFYRTYGNYSGTGPTSEADPATVSDFRLDKYDVTVGRFRQFVNAVLPSSGTGWLPPPGSGKHTYLNGGAGLANTEPDSGVEFETGWLASDDIYVAPTSANLACGESATWTPTPGPNETLPITCVDWYEAYAFCVWDGASLPSDAEWEYAAAGGSEQREYPWGTTDPGTANLYAIFGDGAGTSFYPSGDAPVPYTGLANIAPVGTAYLGAGKWGQLDFEGNIQQWVLDWAYVYDPSVDGADVTGGLNRSLRGTGSNVANGGLHPWFQFAAQPVDSDGTPYRAEGFRCARPPFGASQPVDASAPADSGAATSSVPSCAAGGAGLSTCGSGAGDCCASFEVTGGTFYRTYTNDGTGPTDELYPATVSSFYLDEYDVTVGRFRQFQQAVLPPDGGAGWSPAPGSGKHTHLNGGLGLVEDIPDGGFTYEPGWLASDDSQIAPTTANLQCGNIFYPTWTDTPGSHENLPITCMDWYEAYAFCIWDGGFLPSQAEWEYAAAGGAEQREYPWGSTDPGTANQYAIYGCDYPSADAGGCASVRNIAPVGTASRGAGLWGQLDVTGNVEQWSMDWSPTSGTSGFIVPCTDCYNATPSTWRLALASAFNAVGLLSLTPTWGAAAADMQAPTSRSGAIGFRCAHAPAGVVGPHSGVLDTTLAGTGYLTWFGPTGTSTDSVGLGVAVDYSVTSQPARIVVAGDSTGADGSDRAVALRFLQDGTLDPTFGTGGYWVSPETPPIDGGGATYMGAEAQGLALEPEGQPRIAGYIGTIYPDNADVFGLTSGGAPDTTFGSTGLLSPPVVGGVSMRNAYAIAIDSSQNVIVGGVSTGSAPSPAELTRYTSAGTPDLTFGTGGSVFASLTAGSADAAVSSGAQDAVFAVALQGTSIVAAGDSYDDDGRQDLVVWRYNAYTSPGTLDTTFNGTGYVVLSAIAGDASNAGYDAATGVALDAQGRIYVCGYSGYTADGGTESFVARLTASGSLDTTFGSGGIVLFPPLPLVAGSASSSYASAVAIDSQGRVVVAGAINDGNSDYVVAWRLTSAGTPDDSFAVDGRFMMTATAGYAPDFGRALALTAQDGIVIAGSARTATALVLAVWRLTP
jgi:formylglycine-generating enzyme